MLRNVAPHALPRFAVLLLAVLLLAVLLACGGDDLVLPGDAEPAEIAVVQGDGQSGTVGGLLPDSLAVRVTDTRDRPVVGLAVAFVVTEGGEGAQALPETTTTNSDGRAAAAWVLGAMAGTQRLAARVVGTSADPLEAEFDAAAAPGAAASLALVSGNNQAATPGAALADSLVVRATDQLGNPVAGVTVTWEAMGGGSTDPTTVTTGADGRAASKRTLGLQLGSYPTRATAEGLAGSPVTFNAIATFVPGSGPASIAAQAGAGQTAAVGTAVAVPPSVIVRNSSGAPVAGVAVAFTPGAGSGEVRGSSQTTGLDGIATVERWTLGTAAGPQTLIATATGSGISGNPLTITATAVAGPPDDGRSTLTAAPATIPASTGANTATITVRLRDRFDNAIAGTAVTISATGNGNTITPPTPQTDATGTATAAFSSTAIGTKRITASVAGVTLDDAANVQVVPGPPVAANSTADVPASVRLLTNVAITITTFDAFGHRVTSGGATVRVIQTRTGASQDLPVTDRGDGTYVTTYSPGFFVGTDRLDILLGGNPIQGSPFTVQVTF